MVCEHKRLKKKTLLLRLFNDIEDIERKSKLLDGIPCGTDYPQCKFIRDANIAVAKSSTC